MQLRRRANRPRNAILWKQYALWSIIRFRPTLCGMGRMRWREGLTFCAYFCWGTKSRRSAHTHTICQQRSQRQDAKRGAHREFGRLNKTILKVCFHHEMETTPNIEVGRMDGERVALYMLMFLLASLCRCVNPLTRFGSNKGNRTSITNINTAKYGANAIWWGINELVSF